MKLKHSGFLALAVVVVLFAGTSAQATSISVPNFSFESPDQGLAGGNSGGGDGNSNDQVADWDISATGGSTSGVQDNNDAGSPVYSNVPDGHQWAYFNTGSTGATVGLTLTPGTNTLPTIIAGDAYTLTAYIGHRATVNSGSVVISLLANNVVVGTPVVVNADSITSGTFQLSAAATLTSAQSASLGGQQLSISIVDTNTDGGFSQAGLDDVQLSYVPEPAFLGLLSLGGLGLLARRRRA